MAVYRTVPASEKLLGVTMAQSQPRPSTRLESSLQCATVNYTRVDIIQGNHTSVSSMIGGSILSKVKPHSGFDPIPT